RVDAEKGLIADSGAGCVVEDRKEQRVRRLRLGGNTGLEGLWVRIGALEEEGPDAVLVAAIGALEKGVGVFLGVERRERDPPALKRNPLGPLGVMRVDRGADGLVGRRVRHALSLFQLAVAAEA